MSDINLDFIVNNNSINFTVEPNDITITPTDIQLNISTSGLAIAGGSNTQLQYNNSGQFGGIPNVTYNGSKLSLGNVANVRMTGGTNGYVLQTDGTGNLSWTAQTGNGGGNGTPGGANTQIQYNDSGSFGGNAGFTFNEVDGNVNMPANLIVAGNIIGNTSNANYANFAGTAFNVSGSNVTGAVANATYANAANTANLATYATTANSVNGANVSGQVANALVAGTVYTNAQPNITSLGILSELNVAGTTSIQQAKEKVTANNTGATGTINYDLLDQAIFYKTANATANFTLNFRGNSSVTLDSIMNNNQSLTCTFINTNGANAYLVDALTIDSTLITAKWVYPGAPSVGTNNAQDVYTFNIIKTASNTFNVLASKTGYV